MFTPNRRSSKIVPLNEIHSPQSSIRDRDNDDPIRKSVRRRQIPTVSSSEPADRPIRRPHTIRIDQNVVQRPMPRHRSRRSDAGLESEIRRELKIMDDLQVQIDSLRSRQSQILHRIVDHVRRHDRIAYRDPFQQSQTRWRHFYKLISQYLDEDTPTDATEIIEYIRALPHDSHGQDDDAETAQWGAR